VLLCSGKIYYDLLAQRETAACKTVAIVRIEQLYPFPEAALKTCLKRYPKAREFIWVQEESRNWGAWAYIQATFLEHLSDIRLQCISRAPSAGSAVGSYHQHLNEQEQLVAEALALPSDSGESP